MSTIQDFENAPVGATATSPNGLIALKTGRGAFEWSLYNSHGRPCDDFSSDEMEHFTLNPPAPTTAQEALDLAWELAHPVKEGQVIPEGARYLEVTRSGLRERTAVIDHTISPGLAHLRTRDPLPDPEPDWLDAPAVVAYVKGRVGDPQVFSRGDKAGTWVRDTKVYRWDELVGVVPLYPKEGEKE